MIEYQLSAADQAALPESFANERRYFSFDENDRAKPYAHFFQEEVRPVRAEVLQALEAGMAPPSHGYDLRDAADRLQKPGYDLLETGWTRLPSGVIFVAVHTPMPEVTADMWDWWFGWHGTESARYKLWCPDSHQFSAMGDDRSGRVGLTDRQRYVNNVSYVDEYFGGRLQRLAIRFLDPEKLGVAYPPGSTAICARVTLSTLPVAIGWLIHQVRPTSDGAEMRSRFFLNDAAILPLPRVALPRSTAAQLLTTKPGRKVARLFAGTAVTHIMPSTIGNDMLHHCASEMNHLAGFLPQLHAEFCGMP